MPYVIPGVIGTSLAFFHEGRAFIWSYDLDWNRLLIFKGITLHGIIGRRMYQTWYQMDNLLRSGRLDIRPAITHVMPMEKIDEAIALLRDGRAGKVVLVPWGEKG